MTMVQGNYRPSWAPAQPKVQAPAPLKLGQTAPPSPFLDSPVLALLTDAVVALSAAFYGWGLSVAKNKMSTVMYVIAAASTMKGLHDLGRIDSNRRP